MRNACVMRLTVSLANEYVNIVEIFHQIRKPFPVIIGKECWPAKP